MTMDKQANDQVQTDMVTGDNVPTQVPEARPYTTDDIRGIVQQELQGATRSLQATSDKFAQGAVKQIEKKLEGLTSTLNQQAQMQAGQNWLMQHGNELETDARDSLAQLFQSQNQAMQQPVEMEEPEAAPAEQPRPIESYRTVMERGMRDLGVDPQDPRIDWATGETDLTTAQNRVWTSVRSLLAGQPAPPVAYPPVSTPVTQQQPTSYPQPAVPPPPVIGGGGGAQPLSVTAELDAFNNGLKKASQLSSEAQSLLNG